MHPNVHYAAFSSGFLREAPPDGIDAKCSLSENWPVLTWYKPSNLVVHYRCRICSDGFLLILKALRSMICDRYDGSLYGVDATLAVVWRIATTTSTLLYNMRHQFLLGSDWSRYFHIVIFVIILYICMIILTTYRAANHCVDSPLILVEWRHLQDE